MWTMEWRGNCATAGWRGKACSEAVKEKEKQECRSERKTSEEVHIVKDGLVWQRRMPGIAWDRWSKVATPWRSSSKKKRQITYHAVVMQGETGQFVAYKHAFYYCKGKHFKKLNGDDALTRGMTGLARLRSYNFSSRRWLLALII